MEFIKNYLPINTPEKISQLVQDIIGREKILSQPEELINQVCLQIRKKKLQEMFRTSIAPFIHTLLQNQNKSKSNWSENRSVKNQPDNLKKFNGINKIEGAVKSLRADYLNDKSLGSNRKKTQKSKGNESVTTSRDLDTNSLPKPNNKNVFHRRNQIHEVDEAVSPKSILGRYLKEAARELNLSEQVFQEILIKNNISLIKKFTTKDFNILKADIKQIIKINLNQSAKREVSSQLNEGSFSNRKVENIESKPCLFIRRYNNRFAPSMGKEGNYFKLIYNRAKS